MPLASEPDAVATSRYYKPTPSFLDLLPEIRNEIYRLIFEHDDPLYLASSSYTGQVILHQRFETEDHFLIARRISVLNHHDHAHTGLIPAYQHGIALFRTCRQIYQEASSVFYRNNSITIAKTRTQLFSTRGDIPTDFITDVMTKWLPQFKSFPCPVRNLSLDIDSLDAAQLQKLFRVGSNGTSGSLIEIGPLLCLIWKQNLEISLTMSSVRSKDAKAHNTRSSASMYLDLFHGADISPVALDLLLRSFLQDELCIKRYWRTIHSIQLHRNGCGGVVQFATTILMMEDDCHKPKKRRFYPSTHNRMSFVADNGRNPRIATKQPPSLVSLPREIFNCIMETVFTYEDKQELSIENLRHIRAALAPTYVCRSWYHRYSNYYATHNDFVMKMKTYTHLGVFPSYDRLSQFFHSRSTQLPMTAGLVARGSQQLRQLPPASRVRFAFVYELHGYPLDTGLEDIRFDARLIETDEALFKNFQIDITVFLSDHAGLHFKTVRNRITLDQIRFSYNNLVDQLGSEWNLLDEARYDVWVNGLGDVVEGSKGLSRIKNGCK